MELLDRLAARLAPTGMNLLGAASAAAWDAHAPPHLRAGDLLTGAQSVIVVGSAGRGLWDSFRRAAPHEGDHPLDAYVTHALLDAEHIFRDEGIAARRFEASFTFEPRVDFRTLGRIAGFGDVGPFGLLIHPEHGPWFGLRGAWLIDRELGATTAAAPCAGCAAPCVGDTGATTLDRSTSAMRLRCPIGTSSRYSDEQLHYHHDGTRPGWFNANS